MEDSYINLLFVIEKESNELIHLLKLVSEDEDIQNLYLPQFDLSLDGKFVGTSFDGIFYRRFFMKIRNSENHLYESLINDFINSGWVFSYNSSLDG